MDTALRACTSDEQAQVHRSGSRSPYDIGSMLAWIYRYRTLPRSARIDHRWTTQRHEQKTNPRAESATAGSTSSQNYTVGLRCCDNESGPPRSATPSHPRCWTTKRRRGVLMLNRSKVREERRNSIRVAVQTNARPRNECLCSNQIRAMHKKRSSTAKYPINSISSWHNPNRHRHGNNLRASPCCTVTQLFQAALAS